MHISVPGFMAVDANALLSDLLLAVQQDPPPLAVSSKQLLFPGGDRDESPNELPGPAVARASPRGGPPITRASRAHAHDQKWQGNTYQC
jgi:hypothetical protein